MYVLPHHRSGDMFIFYCPHCPLHKTMSRDSLSHSQIEINWSLVVQHVIIMVIIVTFGHAMALSFLQNIRLAKLLNSFTIMHGPDGPASPSNNK